MEIRRSYDRLISTMGSPTTGKIAYLHWIRAQRVTDLSTFLWHCLFNSLRPKRNRRHFADDIFKCIFVMKMYCLRLKFRWSLFPRVQLRVFQHWVVEWLIADQATSHYLNLCSVVYLRIHVSLGLNELMAVWCRRKQQKRGPGEKPEVAAPNGPRSQLPPTLEFPSPNLEVSFPAAICPEWDLGDI